MEYFLEISLLEKVLTIYLLALNIITFFIYSIDKARSGTTYRRIPEKSLWLLALLGGSPAALLAMKMFRHKTKKVSFQFTLIIIIALQIGLIFFLFKQGILFKALLIQTKYDNPNF